MFVCNVTTANFISSQNAIEKFIWIRCWENWQSDQEATPSLISGQMIKSTNHHDYQKLIAWLKKSRLDRGLTVRQLGELLDEPFQFVSKVEKGQRNLSVHEYVQYCEALNVEVDAGIALLLSRV